MDNVIFQFQSLFNDNSFWSWVLFCGISAISTILVKLCLQLLSFYLRKFAKRTSSVWGNVGIDLLDGLSFPILFICIFVFATRQIAQHQYIRNIFLTVSVIAMAIQVAIWGFHIIKSWKIVVLDKKIKSDPSSSAALGLLYTGIQICFITVLVLIGLSNLGVNISALLAGLGVGGIAVALAAQNVLGDLLASLSIVLDKPFVVGDFVVAGEEKGTVEHIGIKTTRLRSLSGEELILSNKDLLESRVRNFKRMWVRRVVQNFGVTYSTAPDVLEMIPTWVKKIVESQSQLKFDRCHFMAYGASSLDFEFVFFVLDPEYNVFMDLQQKVLIDLFKKFSEQNVNFAFPSRSLYFEKSQPAGSLHDFGENRVE